MVIKIVYNYMYLFGYIIKGSCIIFVKIVIIFIWLKLIWFVNLLIYFLFSSYSVF